MDTDTATSDSVACANPSCSAPAEWRVTLTPDRWVFDPAWLVRDPLWLCSADLELIRAWGWAVGVQQDAWGS